MVSAIALPRSRPERIGPLRSGAFRFALLFATVFALASGLVLLTVHQQVRAYARAATDGMLRTEVAALRGEFREAGLAGLIGAIDRHRQIGADPQFRYLLVDRGGHRLAGDLPLEAGKAGWGRLRDDQPDPDEPPGGGETLKRYGVPLPQGMLLVAATDMFDIEQLGLRLERLTFWCGIGITLAAMAGGYVVGGLFLRRLDRVNDAVGRIMEGRLDARLPSIGFSPEFVRLSAHLNQMLDRNAALMEGLRQVTTDIAHDLRTPLTRLRQQLERGRADAARPADRDAFDVALVQTDGLLAIFHALLRIGTIEGGVGRDRFAPVDLRDLLARVHGAYHAVAEDRGQTLVLDAAVPATVPGDADLMMQLFTNLVENALAHTPAGSRIVMRLRRDGKDAIAEVADDGPGVPEAERPRIVERFYRLDASRHTEGAGLGLAMVVAIATLHDAQFTIDDAAPGLIARLAMATAG